MQQVLKQPLTDLLLRKLKGGDERIEVWDAKLPGFGARVAPSGTKSFVLLYRFRGLPRRLTLGRYPVLGLGLLRSAAGPGVNRRLHEPQRQSCTTSSFFLRKPLRVMTWLPQCGHSLGSLFVCGAVGGWSGERDIKINKGVRRAYHRRRILEDQVTEIGCAAHG